MTERSNLRELIRLMEPALCGGAFVFCTIEKDGLDWLKLEPFCVVREEEGFTLVVDRQAAELHGLACSSLFRLITLSVHSSLEAVGFLATIIENAGRFGNTR